MNKDIKYWMWRESDCKSFEDCIDRHIELETHNITMYECIKEVTWNATCHSCLYPQDDEQGWIYGECLCGERKIVIGQIVKGSEIHDDGYGLIHLEESPELFYTHFKVSDKQLYDLDGFRKEIKSYYENNRNYCGLLRDESTKGNYPYIGDIKSNKFAIINKYKL